MDPILCITGAFPFIPFYDPNTLEERFRIQTEKNRRVVRVTFLNEPSRMIIAVGEPDPPYSVSLYDVLGRNRFLILAGHRERVLGLASISSPTSANPLVVSGGFRDSQVLVFDASTGENLCSMPDAPTRTCRIIHVPEWSSSEFYVAGDLGKVFRYDATRCERVGVYEGHAARWEVHALAARPSRNLLLSGCNDSKVKMWSRDEFQCVMTLDLTDTGRSLYCAEDKHLVIVGLRNGAIEVWDSRNARGRLRKFTPAGRSVYDLERIGENRFVSGSFESVSVWNPSSGRVYHAVTSLGSYVYGVRLLQDLEPASNPEMEERMAFLASLRDRGLESGLIRVYPFRLTFGRWWLVGSDSSSAIVVLSGAKRMRELVKECQDLRTRCLLKDAAIARVKREAASQREEYETLLREASVRVSTLERRISELEAERNV